jgi:hypothetical protein
MDKLGLIFLNIALAAAIVFVVFFWQPQIEEAPLPGTHDAKLGKDAPAMPFRPAPADKAVSR